VTLLRAGIVAGLIASTVALSACSSADPGRAGGTASDPAPAASCAKGTLNATGSTAQQNAIDQWVTDYQSACAGSTINYGGGGSGKGVSDFLAGNTDFAGSDSALKATTGELAAAAKRCASPAADLPMVTGPIAVAFKLAGVTDLTLSAALVAKIFLGKITKWNDPAIAAANAGTTLPATDITVFFRSDESGTTENFERYLKAVDPADFTAATSKVWAGRVGQGKSGSHGVQQGVATTEGGIGYLEWSYAGSANLPTAKIDNGGGAVGLSAESAGAAVAAAQVVGTGNDLTLKLDYATKVRGAYPIILITYEIVCTKYADAAKGALVRSFLSYLAGEGQAGLPDLGYAPLPAGILSKVQASIAAIS
jgi:phosphate transport system substrate-binding protein